MKYKVEYKPNEKSPYWVTNDRNEPIASGNKHKHKDEADIHCMNLNAYFGESDERISAKD